MSLEDISLLDEDLNDPHLPDAHHHLMSGQPRSIQWRRFLRLPCDRQALHEQRAYYMESLRTPEDNDWTYSDTRAGAQLQESDSQQQEQQRADEDDALNVSLDPLSAIIQEEAAKTAREQELELNYRKEKALRKRGQGTQRVIEEEPDDRESYRQLIHKDLQRLPSAVVQQKILAMEDRQQILHRILYIFATQHSNAGYLQGMHEIASYVLYALEQEGGESDLEHTEADCYILTEKMVTSIFAAYDVADELSSEKKPLEVMSRRIVHATSKVWPELHHKLVHAFAHVPSQLVFTKWIRLLFSREITTIDSASQKQHQLQNSPTGQTASSLPRGTTTSHAETVLKLWDALLEAASQIPPQQISSVPPLLMAAEALAVARLWQHGNTILHLCRHSTDDLLHWFMNVPPEPAADIATLIQRMRVVLLNVDSQELPPPLAVSSEILALTAQSQQQQVHQQSQQQLPPMSPNTRQQQQQSLWETASNPLLAHPKLASLTEKLAATTQTIQKRLTEESLAIQKKISEEWETIQKQHEENLRQEEAARRLREDESRRRHRETVYNLDYYGERPDPAQQQVQPSNTNNAPNVASPTNGLLQQRQQPQTIHNTVTTTSARMQNDLAVLQHFLLNVERQPGLTVPPQVWEALGDLQHLQNLLQQNESPR